MTEIRTQASEETSFFATTVSRVAGLRVNHSTIMPFRNNIY